ncbi:MULTISPECIES: hypothetical protein [unclassified Anaerotruncus]|uniref:hypothetical protein n=1 Tax=unclassified Anaerotruncus TaxID=2641626 RepID=UPI0003B61127|nr:MULTISPECIES: hypothetical protein [unclassified Anaerotruncus]MCI9161079.1 hypothetical protein [Anaerotruncus sp.]NCE73576.1 hypothetical protein [Anaerotruncus sp. X29]RKJ97503.1 hypothetical protein D7Y41_07845 [Anaerotruncus sp. 1XD22-93]MCI9234722.1 hypothetical protein [Anaerotruncus sp.]NBK17534.1 hypothetical protein [Anaerotruncus sp. 1XD42-93]
MSDAKQQLPTTTDVFLQMGYFQFIVSSQFVQQVKLQEINSKITLGFINNAYEAAIFPHFPSETSGFAG